MFTIKDRRRPCRASHSVLGPDPFPPGKSRRCLCLRNMGGADPFPRNRRWTVAAVGINAWCNSWWQWTSSFTKQEAHFNPMNILSAGPTDRPTIHSRGDTTGLEEWVCGTDQRFLAHATWILPLMFGACIKIPHRKTVHSWNCRTAALRQHVTSLLSLTIQSHCLHSN
jgi:hypothetical protein